MSDVATTETKPQHPLAIVSEGISKMAGQFKASLPAHVSVEKFMRVTMNAVNNNPDLLKQDRRTLFNSAGRAAQMGLLPDGREGAIIPFKGQCQFMPMVAGIMKLVRNSGEISTWSVQAVYENDSFDYELGDNERIVHKPALTSRGKIIGAYSIVTMKDGEKSREFMSVDEIEAIRKRSRSGGAGPWVTDFPEMAKKTVVRRHSKRLPMSTDLDGVLREDDDLFMPEDTKPAEQPAQAAAPAEKSRRPSRLAKVAEQAPPADVDSDVIEMEPQPAGYADEPPPAEEHESPI